jgi:WhiB family redox-sensing transcriptional regulator
MRELLQYAQVIAPADNLQPDPMSPRSSGDRALPSGGRCTGSIQIEEAKKVCQRCIVKEPCLAWALESGQDAGVWGGLSEDERRALKRRAARNRARLMEQQNQI